MQQPHHPVHMRLCLIIISHALICDVQEMYGHDGSHPSSYQHDPQRLQHQHEEQHEQEQQQQQDQDSHALCNGCQGCEGFRWRKASHKRMVGQHVKRIYFVCAFKQLTGCPAKKTEDRVAGEARPRRHKSQGAIAKAESSASTSHLASGSDNTGRGRTEMRVVVRTVYSGSHNHAPTCQCLPHTHPTATTATTFPPATSFLPTTAMAALLTSAAS
ncbi:unnamed protein product, partial [Closterium sp. NIES-54]